jgi:TRAP-type C4-dicarboxylate transport system permease small subunit
VSHGAEIPGKGPVRDLVPPGALGAATEALSWVNDKLVVVSMLALLAAAGVLTSSVVTRYLFKYPTEWQDEASVFLMVGCTFLCGAYVQSYRGHVGIEALAGVLPRRLNRLRLLFADTVSFLFTTFFSWKSWTLLHEAIGEHQTTSSSWGPPLWIPYGMMAVGMSLVALQILIQLAGRLAQPGAAR